MGLLAVLSGCRWEKGQLPFCELVNGRMCFSWFSENGLLLHTLRLKSKPGGAHSERRCKGDQLPHFLCQCKHGASISGHQNIRRMTRGYHLMSSQLACARVCLSVCLSLEQERE